MALSAMSRISPRWSRTERQVPEQAAFYVTIAAMVVVATVTMLAGLYGAKMRSTSNFLDAARTLGPRWNAAAISGQYLSAASFLGVAGLVLGGVVDQ